MPIIPYFSKKNSMLGNFSTAFSLKILKGRLLKMFMSQCNSDTKALEIHPERYHCQREADMCSKHVCARLCHDANALGCRRAAASQPKLAVMFVNGCVAFFSNYFLQEPTEADLKSSVNDPHHSLPVCLMLMAGWENTVSIQEESAIQVSPKMISNPTF